jgi:hypothetical protein
MSAIAIGYVLFAPISENLTEQIYFMNWAIYISMYGVFFYHYPLKNISKWSVNAPISKEGLISFNIIFQFFKIFVTLGLLSLVLTVEFHLFKDNFYIDKLNDNILVFKDIFISKKESIIKTKFLPSDYFLAFFIGASFIGAFLFNVAPYGTFQQRIITWDNTKNSVLYLFKNHPILSSLFIFFIFSLKWIVQSRPILGGLFFFLLSLLVIKTYDSILLFSRRFQFFLVSLAVSTSILSSVFLWQYSLLIQKGFPLTETEKIKEEVFLGKNIFEEDPIGKLHSLLSNPEICKDDINSLVRLYRKMDLPEDKKLFEKKDAMKNLIFNKKECGFFTSLKLIPKIESLSVDKKLKILNKVLELLPPGSSATGVETLNKIPPKFFNKKDIGILLSTKNFYAQLSAMLLMKDIPEQLVLDLLRFNIKKISPLLKGRLRDLVIEKSCIIFTGSVENFLEKKVISYCRKGRSVSSILPRPL